jgi:hypothetical protein
MNSGTLICLWILVFPIGIIEVSTSPKCCFWFYFSSLHDYWPPSTRNSLVHISRGEMVRCEQRAFQHLKMRKMQISWNIKSNCVTDFLLTLLIRAWMIILLNTWWAHKRQTFTLISIKIMKICIFLFTSNRVFKHKEVVSNLHVCSNDLGKMWTSYTFHLSTTILTSTHTKELKFFSHNICRDV